MRKFHRQQQQIQHEGLTSNILGHTATNLVPVSHRTFDKLKLYSDGKNIDPSPCLKRTITPTLF